jgi:hypothetical protein
MIKFVDSSLLKPYPKGNKHMNVRQNTCRLMPGISLFGGEKPRWYRGCVPAYPQQAERMRAAWNEFSKNKT